MRRHLLQSAARPSGATPDRRLRAPLVCLALLCLLAPATAAQTTIGPLTFDGSGYRPGQPAAGLVVDQIDGTPIAPIRFDFSMDGRPSDTAAVRMGPSGSVWVRGYGLEGPTAGEVEIDLGQPVVMASLGIGLSSSTAESRSIVVELRSGIGELVGRLEFGTSAAGDGGFSGTRVEASAAQPFQSLSIRFASSARRFILDDLLLLTASELPVSPPPSPMPTFGPGTGEPHAVVLGGGRLMTAWSRDGRLFLQALVDGDPDGDSVPVEFGVHVDSAPRLLSLRDGSLAVAWRRSGGDAAGVWMRRFDHELRPLTPPLRVGALPAEVSGATSITMAETSVGLVVAWDEDGGGGMLFVGPRSTRSLESSAGGGSAPCGASVAALGKGFVAVSCGSPSSHAPEARNAVVAQRHDARGDPVGPLVTLSDRLTGRAGQLALATLPAWGLDPLPEVLVAWVQHAPSGTSVIFGRVLDESGARSPILRLQETVGAVTSTPAVAASPTGDFAAAWIEHAPERRVSARFFHRSGIPASPELAVAKDPARPPGVVTAAWDDDDLVLLFTNGTETDAPESHVRIIDADLGEKPCFATRSVLCLDSERFRLSVEWRDFEGGSGQGTSVPLSRNTGYFWFFDEGAADLIVKVLDGTATNGHHWVFFGSLSNVSFDLLVEDRLTGLTRTYTNPVGTFASRGDTRAFPSAPLPSQGAHTLAPLSLAALDLTDVTADWTEDAAANGTAPDPTVTAACQSAGADPGSFCLAGRYLVQVRWTDFQGGSGIGRGTALSHDSGAIWFFEPANIELVVKVLDGSSVNGRTWVFFGSLTNVAFTLDVTDTVTGGNVTYANERGHFASVGDTDALPAAN